MFAGVAELADAPALGAGGPAGQVRLLSPAPRKRRLRKQSSFSVIFAFRRVICPSARDICFASDMPAGGSGENNITETTGFNITFCASKIYHSVVDGISLKTNDYVRVRIHTQNGKNIFFVARTKRKCTPKGCFFFWFKEGRT